MILLAVCVGPADTAAETLCAAEYFGGDRPIGDSVFGAPECVFVRIQEEPDIGAVGGGEAEGVDDCAVGKIKYADPHFVARPGVFKHADDAPAYGLFCEPLALNRCGDGRFVRSVICEILYALPQGCEIRSAIAERP